MNELEPISHSIQNDNFFFLIAYNSKVFILLITFLKNEIFNFGIRVTIKLLAFNMKSVKFTVDKDDSKNADFSRYEIILEYNGC